jgi:trimethylamine--corrinoid protein Co-methyltransferase
MVMGGATGPVTIAGTITLQNAELLASLFLTNIICGDIDMYGAYCHSVDPSSLLCSFGSPNQALLGIASAQMAKHYGFKSASNSGLTDSVMPDFQCGFEKASNAIFGCLAGNGDMGAQGIVGADQGISLEQLILDNEWINAYNYILNGAEVTEETIGADVIESVGIGGEFVSEEHTVEYLRDSFYFSKFFNRKGWDTIENDGDVSLLDRAHNLLETWTTGYKEMTPKIEQAQFEEIQYISKTALKNLVK